MEMDAMTPPMMGLTQPQIEAVFAEPISVQAARLDVRAGKHEAYGSWADRVRKAALLAMTAAAPPAALPEEVREIQIRLMAKTGSRYVGEPGYDGPKLVYLNPDGPDAAALLTRLSVEREELVALLKVIDADQWRHRRTEIRALLARISKGADTQC
jgi:hypothetical protein